MSTHVVRKIGLNDGEFHQVVHEDEPNKTIADYDENDALSDDEVPVTKDQYFEFTDGYGIMRLIRLILYIQTIAIMMDHPSFKMPLMYDITAGGVLYYSLRFYSRPFLDGFYLIEYFWNELLTLLKSSHLFPEKDIDNTKVEVNAHLHPQYYFNENQSEDHRLLKTNPYITGGETKKESSSLSLSFIITSEPQYWHALKHYAHYFLGIAFVIFALLFFLKFWEIEDYSNREEVKVWLHRYVADGWSKRGGLNVVLSVIKIIIVIGTIVLFVNSLANSLGDDSLNNGHVIGVIFGVAISVVIIISLIGFIGIKTTEASFKRYVSQNVAYTSAIVLKRAVKAKLDVGLVILVALFMPVLYNLFHALLMFLQWNDTRSNKVELAINYYIPCYYLAFPPYRTQRLDEESFCPVAKYSSEEQTLGSQGFYSEQSILSCDSYLGIIIYVLSASGFTFMIIGYSWFFYSMIAQVEQEFKSSRWVDVLLKLINILDEEKLQYQKLFTWSSRMNISWKSEFRKQFANIRFMIVWFLITGIRIIKSIFRIILRPVFAILIPLRFFMLRILVLTMLMISSISTARAIRKRKSLLSSNSRSHSQSNLSQSMTPSKNSRFRRSLQESLHISASTRSSKLRSSQSVQKLPTSPSQRRLDSQSPSKGDVESSGSRPDTGGRARPPPPKTPTMKAVREKLRGSRVMDQQEDDDDQVGFDDDADRKTSRKKRKHSQMVANITQSNTDKNASTTLDSQVALSTKIKPIGEINDNSYSNSNSNNFHSRKRQRRRSSIFNRLSAIFTNISVAVNGNSTSQRRRSSIATSDQGDDDVIFISPNDASDSENAQGVDPWSLSTKNISSMEAYIMKIDIVKIIQDTIYYIWDRFTKLMMRIGFIAWIRVKINLFIYRFCNSRRFDEFESATQGLQAMGGNAAPWRVQQTLGSKFQLLAKMDNHTVTELRFAKKFFVSEHDLVISVFDYTLDSAGLITLCLPYNYYRMKWFLVILFEAMLYALFGALLTRYYSWQDRIYTVLVVNIIFGIITYVAHPFTEDIDRWLEFSGRCLVVVICMGTLIYYEVNAKGIKETDIYLYEPWRNFQYFIDVITGKESGVKVFVDTVMVLFFYGYLIYIAHMLGLFGLVDRVITSTIFSFHDHILDFLVEKVEERCFGMENMMSGLQFLQQWDDILRSQRRYALLTWPDVRPSYLVPFSAKLFEIKWAAFFNLTIKNLRSSLGLTILHTTMFSADCEVARWIIHHAPELLLTQDSQNDTPITIAMKECAYFLLVYGEQNQGALDDGTSFSDEAFAVYYPEIDEIRDEIFDNGEFIPEYCIFYELTSQDLILLREEGRYIEPSKVDLQALEATVNEEKAKGKLNTAAQQMLEKIYFSQQVQRTKERKKYKKMQAEKISLATKRFPEDSINNNYETGQVSAWSVVGYSVPDEQIFLDGKIVNKMKKDPDYHYDCSHALVMNYEASGEGFKKEKEGSVMSIFSGSQEKGSFDEESAVTMNTKNKLKDFHSIALDKRYVVSTHKKVNPVDPSIVVPWNDSRLKEYPDFDKRSKKGLRPSSAMSTPRNTSSKKRQSSFMTTNDTQSVHSNTSNNTRFTGMNSKLREQIMKETRWKICKFAEILMSAEIAAVCKDFTWDITDFKAFNKLASINQGKIAQNLALVCHLNPPEGFVRLSDWSVQVPQDTFDEKPEEQMNMLVKSIVTFVGAVEKVATTATQAVDTVNYVVSNLAANEVIKGRNRRRRTTRMLSNSLNNTPRKSKHDDEHRDGDDDAENTTTVHDDGMLSDRVIQYLAEALVSSTHHLDLSDNELSNNARRAWRAITRALRRQQSSFFLPSIFAPPKPIMLLSLILSRNELDCGDCVFLSDIFTHQKQLQYVDLSFNRIGSRGVMRMCRALRLHENLVTLRLHHNQIGPAAGKEIGVFIKVSRSIKVLDLSYNHLGEMVRFPTMISREKIPSASHDICLGLKANRSIEILDLSYNHLGGSLADCLPSAVNKHFTLHTLDISGNDLGPEQGAKLLFLLAGNPNGAKYARQKELFLKVIKERQSQRLQEEKEWQSKMQRLTAGKDDDAELYKLNSNQDKRPMTALVSSSTGVELNIFNDPLNDILEMSNIAKQSAPVKPAAVTPSKAAETRKKLIRPESSYSLDVNAETKVMLEQIGDGFDDQIHTMTYPAKGLISLSVANNQLGPFSGHAIADVISRMPQLCHLDISGNSLGPIGGERIADQLELQYHIKPREFLKLALYEIEESKYHGRNAKKRKKIYTNLHTLIMDRNGFGPKVMSSFMMCIKSPRCGIINMQLSDNPLGVSNIEIAGKAYEASKATREAMSENSTLIEFNLNNTQFAPTDIVTIFGGLCHNITLQRLSLRDVYIDEPSCLQLSHVLHTCLSITKLDLNNCMIGPNGGALVTQKIRTRSHLYTHIDLSNNSMGPIPAIYLADALKRKDCAITVLKLAGNDFLEEGGVPIAQGLYVNESVRVLDLSNNSFSPRVAMALADTAKGLFKHGMKVRDNYIKKWVLNDNPEFGVKAARHLLRCLGTNIVEHIEMTNVGAGPSTAEVISMALRDPLVAWSYLDISNNALTRMGLHQVFWAVRSNKRLRILKVGENQAGTLFCQNADALLSHGISVPVAIRNNSLLREIDLSYNSITSEAGLNILDALIDNQTIKRFSLRGNLLNDEVALMIPDLLRCNTVLEELDLSYNQLGYTAMTDLAENLQYNRSLKVLHLQYNKFGGATKTTLEKFHRSLMMNYSLQILNLDGNRLGPEWGIAIAEIVARNYTITQLSLRDNRLNKVSGRALLNSFKHNPYLFQLALSSDEIGDELWEEFKEVFQNKQASVHPDQLRTESKLTEKQSKLLQSYHVMEHHH